jgi:dipeptidyl aminopeptidase/acylaminoacyl peptidase
VLSVRLVGCIPAFVGLGTPNRYSSGMRDDSVPILSTEVAYARLRTLGRDVTFRRVPRAGHALVPEGGTMADVQKDYEAIMAWFERR